MPRQPGYQENEFNQEGRRDAYGEVVRPGRRVEMFEATLSDQAGEALMRARGWRLRTEAVSFESPPSPMALVALFDRLPVNVETREEVRSGLARIAQTGGMDFFAEPDNSPNTEFIDRLMGKV